MFVPIYDDNPLRTITWPYVTWAIVALNCLVFALQATGMPEQVTISFALVPAELVSMGVLGGAAAGSAEAIAVPERFTLFTYMFFHGDVFHLAGNMLFLWVFGDNVEDALGHGRFAVFYAACGVFAGLFHAVMLSASPIPLIGASGAVAGVITAYLVFYPRVLVWVLVFRFLPIKISAAFVLGFWVLTQISMVAMPYIVPGTQVGPVAWWAHIGGILAGLALGPLMRLPHPVADGGERPG